jgi:hypothetical protein
MKKNLREDPEFFDSVIFSDECYLKAEKCGNIYVRGPRGHKFAKRYVR